MSYTLGDIVAGLPSKGAGRQNWGSTADGSIGIVAAQQAVQEITATAELEELKYQTPVPPATPLALTVGNPIVPFSQIINTIGTNSAFPQFQPYQSIITDFTDAYDGWIWFTGTTSQSPAVNQSGRIIKYRRINAVDMYTYGVTSNNQMSYGVSPPVYYSRFGTNYQVGPAPNNPYFFFFRVKIRHPFPANNLAFMPIFAPDEWMEVFQYAAILRLAKDEGIQDSSIYKTAMDFLKMAGMDPWTLRTLQMARDERHNDRRLSLRTSVYTFR